MAAETASGTPGTGAFTGSEVVVTLLSGTELRGVVEALNPQQTGFFLRPPGGSVGTGRRIELAHVKTIAFLPSQRRGGGKRPGFPANARLVTVRFLDDSVQRGVAENFGGPRRGIFLVPTDTEDVERLYVPVTAVAEVVSVERLGDILTTQGLVSREMVEQAIHRQEELRRETLGQILLRQKALSESQLAQGLDLQKSRREARIGEILLEQGFISAEELKDALAAQQQQRSKRLGEVMIDMGLASYKMIGIALSIQYNVPFVSLNVQQIDPLLRQRVPVELAKKWSLMPVSLEDDLLTVAVADPTGYAAKAELRTLTRCVVTEVVATPQDIARAFTAFYGA